MLWSCSSSFKNSHPKSPWNSSLHFIMQPEDPHIKTEINSIYKSLCVFLLWANCSVFASNREILPYFYFWKYHCLRSILFYSSVFGVDHMAVKYIFIYNLCTAFTCYRIEGNWNGTWTDIFTCIFTSMQSLRKFIPRTSWN